LGRFFRLAVSPEPERRSRASPARETARAGQARVISELLAETNGPNITSELLLFAPHNRPFRFLIRSFRQRSVWRGRAHLKDAVKNKTITWIVIIATGIVASACSDRPLICVPIWVAFSSLVLTISFRVAYRSKDSSDEPLPTFGKMYRASAIFFLSLIACFLLALILGQIWTGFSLDPIPGRWSILSAGATFILALAYRKHSKSTPLYWLASCCFAFTGLCLMFHC
jgi:hypothetical protein